MDRIKIYKIKMRSVQNIVLRFSGFNGSISGDLEKHVISVEII